MRKYLFMIAVLAISLVSCSSELDTVIETPPTSTKAIMDILEFATEADFLLAAQNPEQTLQKVQAIADFKSISDEYEAAWEIEEEYYASEEKYKEFKKMFPHLYFPEYEDDYSFFLPVSDKYIAKLLNVEGNVMIGGKVVNYVDIKTPEKLLSLGLLAPNITDKSVTRAPDQTTVFENNIPDQVNNDEDRKMWVNTRVGMKGGLPATFIIISYRKKGPFKWKSYTSEAAIVGTLRYASGHYKVFRRNVDRKRGGGSVEFEFLAPYPAPNPFPCKGTKLEIEYQGISGSFYMNVDTSKV